MTINIDRVTEAETNRGNIIFINSEKEKINKPRGCCVVRHADFPTDHSADALVSEESINNIILECLTSRQISKAVLFTVGINTGYRAGDLVGFRVEDVMQNGKIVDALYVQEDKTNKVREVPLNSVVKKVLAYIIDKKRLKSENYLFTGDGNKRTYIAGFEYGKNGEVTKVVTSGNRYDDEGNERQAAPMLVGSVTRWLKGLCTQLGIEGHYSSHAMRKTFVEFLSRDWIDNRNALVANVALGHSSLRTTIDYYMGIDKKKLKETWLGLNLGEQAWDLYLENNQI